MMNLLERHTFYKFIKYFQESLNQTRSYCVSEHLPNNGKKSFQVTPLRARKIKKATSASNKVLLQFEILFCHNCHLIIFLRFLERLIILQIRNWCALWAVKEAMDASLFCSFGAMKKPDQMAGMVAMVDM